MKNLVNTGNIPDNSLLQRGHHGVDYVDSYACTFYDQEDAINIVTLGRLFLGSGSKWVERLFAIRNKVARLLGLKTPGHIKDRQNLAEAFMFQPGQRLGLFKVYEKNAQELVLGEDDKHLNFRVSLFLENLVDGQRQVSITTAVTFNNRFGRLYFSLVRPFHKVIVKSMLKGMMKRLESQRQLMAENV